MKVVLLIALFVFLPSFVPTAEAHRSGCHAAHSCPSDTGSYVCGDKGIDTYCPGRAAKPKPATIPRTYPADINWAAYGISRDLVTFLEINGGLPVFGLPKTQRAFDDAGNLVWVFERYRVEYHPADDHGAGNDRYAFQIGILGEARLIQLGRIWQNEPRAEPKPGCAYFQETGHNLCEPFLSYWKAHGFFLGDPRDLGAESLALFGYPISESTMENGSDGVARPTQWFQRARFEDHGTEGILLGLLGNEVYGL